MELPTNWWQYKSVADKLGEWFNHHLLALFLLCKTKSQTYNSFYTGFLIDHEGFLLWITAGHVIDQIKAILSNDKISIKVARWADGYKIAGAESLPIDINDLKTKCLSVKDPDLGIILITGINKLNICNNGYKNILTKQAWEKIEFSHPDGYCLLGYPDPYNEINETISTDNKIISTAFASLSCLPVQELEYSQMKDKNEFWNDPNAFYGKLLPFIDEPQNIPETIKGMSGGPLFSIQIEPSNKIRYYLYGLQRGWLKNRRLIRVEPIQKIVDIIDTLKTFHKPLQ